MQTSEGVVELTGLLFSEDISELAPALVEALNAIGAVQTNQEGKVQSDRANYTYKYADLAAVLEAGREPLFKAGLVLLQGASTRFNANTPIPDVIVDTMLLHKSGQWVRSYLTLRPIKGDPQACGSAETYARRYAATAILGIAVEDDDGKAASAAGKGDAAAAAEITQPPDEARIVRSLFDSAFKDKTDAPKYGPWLEENVAPGLSKRSPKIPTADELAKAKTLLQMMLSTKPADAARPVPVHGATPPKAEHGDPKMTEHTQKRLFAILGKRNITSKPDRIEFAFAAGVRTIKDEPLQSFSELTEAQGAFLCNRGELIPLPADEEAAPV